MTHLSIEADHRKSSGLVALSGELDLATAEAAERRLRAFERASGLDTLVRDLRGPRFIHSTGLRGPEPVHRVFRLAMLEERLTFVDDPAEVEG